MSQTNPAKSTAPGKPKKEKKEAATNSYVRI